jgi:hypothetical protein
MITSPDQQAVTVGPPFPVVPFDKTDQVGLYQVTQVVHGLARQGAFTVNLFDPLQSQLTPARALPVVHSTDFTLGNNMVPRELREVWPWIAAFLLLVLCTEWWLFSRGYKQQNVLAVQHQGTSLARAGQLQSRTPPGRLAVMQNQLEARYRMTVKRLTKAIKHARSRLVSRR